jgi:DNA-binding CsgD family transcriptional regulator
MATSADLAQRLRRLARSGLDQDELLRRANEVLDRAVGFDSSVWATVDPASLLFTGCTPFGFHPDRAGHRSRAFDREIRGSDRLTLRRLVRGSPAVGTLCQGPSEPGDIEREHELREVYDIVDELVAGLVTGGQCWGAVRAFRLDPRSHPFTSDDVARFAAASAPLADGLRLAFLRHAAANPEGVIDPPGVLTLDPSGQVISCSESALAWVEGLSDASNGFATMASLAARVGTGGDASTVLAGKRGVFALHASHLCDGEGLAIIVERPRPLELTPRIMQAYNLTPREHQVTGLVLRGETTAQISRALGVSGYTVQDHLKSIFAKVGVRTRRQLVNEVHTRLYLPPVDADLRP